MIHKARIKLKEGYGKEIVSSLQEKGFDRIKLHGWGITAEYKANYYICAEGSCQFNKEIKALKGGEDVEKIELSTAMRYSFILPFYKLKWMLNPGDRRYMKGIRKSMEDSRERYKELADADQISKSP